jgi:hypothetical protein
MDRFKLKKLTKTEVRKQYHFKIYSRYADLEGSGERRDINGARENVEQHTKSSATGAIKP